MTNKLYIIYQLLFVLFVYLLLCNIQSSEQFNTSPKISFCITCMNRFHQLKTVLPYNLIKNKKYKNQIEFVLVNFIINNSGKIIDKWVRNTFKKDIKSGYLKYYVCYNLDSWHASICKNTAHKYGKGQLLYNLDCDNYLNPNEVAFLLKQNLNNLLYNGGSGTSLDGTAGRICLSAKYFNYLGGYNEYFYPSGYQDIDLLRRCETYLNRRAIKNKQIKNTAIKNTKLENIKNVKYNLLPWSKMNNLNKKISIDKIKKKDLVNYHTIGLTATLVKLK